MYHLGQYVQYCTKPCTISLSNPFFGCTTFQVVYGVQPFVQYCTTYVQRCTGCTGCTDCTTFCTIL